MLLSIEDYRRLIEALEEAEAMIAIWRNGMNTLAAVSPTAVLALDVYFSEDALHVRLSDGREVSTPLEWFPRLRVPPQNNATIGGSSRAALASIGKA